MAENKISKKKLKALQFRSEKFHKKSAKLEAAEAAVAAAKKEKSQVKASKQADISAEKPPSKTAQKIAAGGSDADSKQTPSSKKTKKRRRKGANEGAAPENKVILFVGNLPKDSTVETLQLHFKPCGQIPRVRIPTEKGTGKMRGFAFVEFLNPGPNVVSKALKFHHTVYKDKKINIELTAGGGGKAANRMQKIREKNAKYKEEMRERVAREEKVAQGKQDERHKVKAEDAVGVHPDRLKLLG
ncbi:RNA-binding protein [Schizosaccharomyces japonicus yFS275]|uniref:RNA-binding protein n=1 Tax=Schizosaccharomyces japonicus (strain yFS275 / FY16936) TaxID=402676 RepID=B6K012_SCHJY|nr:RNA-binding protein [Schizosaccharomyces japonicus yFS275]EEB06162.1 RNA-binding protein [Schizosaccharomyces japonicus yFS275]